MFRFVMILAALALPILIADGADARCVRGAAGLRRGLSWCWRGRSWRRRSARSSSRGQPQWRSEQGRATQVAVAYNRWPGEPLGVPPTARGLRCLVSVTPLLHSYWVCRDLARLVAKQPSHEFGEDALAVRTMAIEERDNLPARIARQTVPR